MLPKKIINIYKSSLLLKGVYTPNSFPYGLAGQVHRPTTDDSLGPDLSLCKLSATADTFLVVDTNIALHQARRWCVLPCRACLASVLYEMCAARPSRLTFWSTQPSWM